MTTKNYEDIFWSKVDIKSSDECWEYKEGKISNGYGRFWNGDSYVGSHRFAWEAHNKTKIPKGLCILHRCDNPPCCNPNHLYCGTHSNNVQDREKRNPDNQGGGKPKLYSGEIWLIRKLKIIIGRNDRRVIYKFSASTLCKMFKVSHGTIFRIWNSDKYLCKEGYYI